MKLVVTGANGFLGSNLLKVLRKDYPQTFALIRPSSDLSEIDGSVEPSAHGDVTDLASLEKAFQGADTVFHLAGVIAYKKSQRPLMDKVNVQGTANVVEACLRAGVRRLVHLSSVTAIGAGYTPDQILNEESEFNLSKLDLGYFETKRQAEEIVQQAARDRGLDAVILNPSTIYGPGDARKGSRGTQLKVARGRFPFYTSGGVSIIGVDDAIEGILAAWKKGRKGERYILSGENILIRDLFRIIAEEAGVPAPRYKLPTFVLFLLGAIGDLKEKLGLSSSVSTENAWTSTLYHWFDNSKARRELGVNPKPARVALKASLDWIKQHGLLEEKKK